MASGVYRRASQMIQKAKGPKWKQELVLDHKFDFIDVEEFRERSCMLVIRYMTLLCSVIISFLVYGADIWTACILLIYDKWSLSSPPKIPLYISKWIYVGCIAISFLLLAWEINKTRNIMETRDISLAVTNPLAYRTYSVRSYSHFCLLYKIKSSTKWSDVVIFYVFYTLKGWKKVVVAQGPRQIIAGITLYAMLKSAWTDKQTGGFKFSDDWDTYGDDWQQRMALISMSFTCILWIISAISILIATVLYFFILCQIQGNLKEYCCHKIDKRIDEMLQQQRKKRIREKEKEMGKNYAASVNSKKSKKSNQKDAMEPAPALPTLPVFNDASLYASENKVVNKPWLYQHSEQQDSFYYENQPMTPLETSYSLHRNPTKYSPYNESPMVANNNNNNNYYQSSTGYLPQDNSYSNYYNNGSTTGASQYSNTIANPTNTSTGYVNRTFQHSSSNNLHEHDNSSYQKANTYDSYPVTQNSPPLQNATNANYNSSQYTESSQIQNNISYTQQNAKNDEGSIQQNYEEQDAKNYKANNFYSDRYSDNTSSYYGNQNDSYQLQNTTKYNANAYNANHSEYSYQSSLSNTTPSSNNKTNNYTNYI